MANIIGRLFRLTSFGESHGTSVGGVIEGCPAGITLSIEGIQHELSRRRPGQSDISTSRREEDHVEILSGLFEGRTTGMPIAFLVHNHDQRSSDYQELKDLYRPSHADYTWQQKYGIRDYRGGGRSSAREHIARVVAGAVARQVLALRGIRLYAYTSQIGPVRLPDLPGGYTEDQVDSNPVRCPDGVYAKKMMDCIQKVKQQGDSIGGVVSCRILGVPVGLGEPVFDRFQARLAHAEMSINAARGFEFGEGFAAASMKGSEHNDSFVMRDGQIRTQTNHAGGLQGGVSNGEEIYFRVAFKPTSTISMPQQTVDRDGKEVTLAARGRHDPCVVPRAVPVVEAMAAIVTLDMLLESQTVHLDGCDKKTSENCANCN